MGSQRTGINYSIDDIEYIELYVSNCHQASHYYRAVLGFTDLGPIAYDNQTPSDRTSIAMLQGGIRLILTAPLSGSSEVAEHLRTHGEGIKDVAFSVTNLETIFDHAVAHGAAVLQTPSTHRFISTPAKVARIRACGDVVHSLIEHNSDSPSAFSNGLPHQIPRTGPDTGLIGIDHVALAVRAGELDSQIDFYVSALGFQETHRENISTDYSAMRSKVVQTKGGTVRLPIMEPAVGLRNSQIDTFINYHAGPGVQHLAFRSLDIIKSVSVLADSIEFLSTPKTYYDSVQTRVGMTPNELDSLRRYGILADRDASGTLLQVFTKPIGTRPTVFLEIVERRGAEGFGGNNIKALFEAVERTQEDTGVVS